MSPHSRRLIALVTSLVIVGVLFAVWALFLRAQIKGEPLFGNVAKGFGPFGVIEDNVSQVYSSIREGVEGVQKEFSFSSTTAEKSENELENDGQNAILELYGGEGI